MAQVVLVRVQPRAAALCAERLEQRGIPAEVIDHPNGIALLLAAGTYRVRVAVDEADLARARAALDEWEVESAPRIAQEARSFARDLALAALPAAGLGLLVWRASADPLRAVAAGATAWFAAVLLVALVRRLRARRRGGDGSRPA